MISLTKKEYYPWIRRSSATTPWARKYINIDFLKSEVKRIDDTKKWYDLFIKTPENSAMPEVIYYSLPINLSEGWVESSQDIGNYEPKGFSAIRNDLQVPLIALFPRDKALPQDYSLIRIISSRKVVLLNRKVELENCCKFALIVEDFEILPADQLYVDVDFDKKLVSEILYTHLGHNEIVAKSLQSPIFGSPVMIGKYGGVGLASMMNRSPFVDELLKKIQQMLPPEYRSIPPPESSSEGAWVNLSTDYFPRLGKEKIDFHVAEKIVGSNGTVGVSSGNSYDIINSEWNNRIKSGKDYSFLGSLMPSGDGIDLFNEMLRKFTQTEITAFHYDKIREDDVYLKTMNKDINEDLWLTIVHARQFQPTIDEKEVNLGSWQAKIKKDWDVFLPEMGFKDDLEFVKGIKTSQTMNNILKIAQSFARSAGRNQVAEQDIKEARRIFVSSAEDLVHHPVTQKAKEEVKQQKKQDKIQSIQTLLESGPNSIEGMWEKLVDTGIYKDRADFEATVDILHKKGFIYEPRQGVFLWV